MAGGFEGSFIMAKSDHNIGQSKEKAVGCRAGESRRAGESPGQRKAVGGMP